MRFLYYEKENRDPNEIVNTLWGCETTFSRCAGFCQRHGKYMTVKQIKNKGCLSKQCVNLAKIETHYYWTWRENRLRMKKENKK